VHHNLVRATPQQSIYQRSTTARQNVEPFCYCEPEYSIQMAGAGTGMALGGWLGGFLFDVSGAYTWSIAAAILTTCLGIPLALALPRYKRPPAAGSKRTLQKFHDVLTGQ
jgi:hypothetical protein